jgi:hypothetical protein
MSSVKYQKAYDRMTEEQKQIMANLYMKGINHDGHSWNTYGDIEDAVADLLELTKMLYEKEEVITNDTLS